MPIHVLSADIASKIAAGEVVERPASVVKELLENALDAKASEINIRCLEAGKKLIEVEDNGIGISGEELPLAVLRHATSKIEQAEDLFQIRTLGFRGEALASIASISRFTLTSRTAEMEYGTRLEVEGGISKGIRILGAPFGTTVRVEDLFYNVPARQKFLKHDQTERQHIDQVVANYALAYPQVKIKFFQEGREVLNTSGNGNRLEVLVSLLGVDTALKMIEVMFEDNRIRISGFISPSHLTRSNRKDFHFFINQRPIQDISLGSAVMQGYQNYLMVGRYPMVWLFIEIDPQEVDVNVHPTKAEVRLANPGWLFSQVQHAVRRALMSRSPFPEVTSNSGWEFPVVQPSVVRTVNHPEPAELSEQDKYHQKVITPTERIPLLRVIGQVASTYLIAEGPDGLYLIDQHAAHERVLFEKFIRQAPDQISSQNLLEPVIVEVTASQARMLEDQLPFIKKLGFDVEIFGANTFQIRSIPTLVKGLAPEAAFRAIIDDFEEDETPLQRELLHKLIARICKRAAVKGGQVLTLEEQRALVLDLEACESPRTCPHGRPTMIHLSVDLLERQFGRRGAI